MAPGKFAFYGVVQKPILPESLYVCYGVVTDAEDSKPLQIRDVGPVSPPTDVDSFVLDPDRLVALDPHIVRIDRRDKRQG